MQSNFLNKRNIQNSQPTVKSVEHNGIRYSSPGDEMGYIIATDIKTNKTIWTKQIYKVLFNNESSNDFTRSIVNRLSLKDDELQIYNENKEIFHLDINSRIVKKI